MNFNYPFPRAGCCKLISPPHLSVSLLSSSLHVCSPLTSPYLETSLPFSPCLCFVLISTYPNPYQTKIRMFGTHRVFPDRPLLIPFLWLNPSQPDYSCVVSPTFPCTHPHHVFSAGKLFKVKTAFFLQCSIKPCHAFLCAQSKHK